MPKKKTWKLIELKNWSIKNSQILTGLIKENQKTLVHAIYLEKYDEGELIYKYIDTKISWLGSFKRKNRKLKESKTWVRITITEISLLLPLPSSNSN